LIINKVPDAHYAIIGGSGTFSIDFPEEIGHQGVKLLASGMIFDTPYGSSPPFKIFTLGEKQVLTLKMHGWRDGVNRADASKQVFWVLREAGVKKILAEGGVGSINRLLRPSDLIVPTDYIDYSMRKDVSLGSAYLLIMRQPVCPDIRDILVQTAEKKADGRVFDRGVYAVTDGRHFESVAEIEMLHRLGADIVGQSMCPEVYLAREIGACYGRLDLVVNYAEGVVEEWDYKNFIRMFFSEPKRVGSILLDAIGETPSGQLCGCNLNRKPTLLREDL
jgi:5'-methylthioadenosine phosphorylase